MTFHFTVADLFNDVSVLPYLPILDSELSVSEEEDAYVARMQTFAPHVPEEVLREWFYRHWNDLDDYAFLDFSTLRFELQTWSLEQIPGREAFADPKFCDSFSSNFEERREGRYDWLMHHMHEHGTWNTPPILLHNLHGKLRGSARFPLRVPWHLLEGHRRLSFLQHLRKIGTASSSHAVWVASKV